MISMVVHRRAAWGLVGLAGVWIGVSQRRCLRMLCVLTVMPLLLGSSLPPTARAAQCRR